MLCSEKSIINFCKIYYFCFSSKILDLMLWIINLNTKFSMKKKHSFYCFCLFLGASQQLITENILFDGNNREYIVYVPTSYSSSISTPILFAFHGGSGYAYEFMNNEADFRSISDTAGFISILRLLKTQMMTILLIGFTRSLLITRIYFLLRH